MELLGPAVFQYLVNIEKARTPQHDARNVLEPTEGFGRASCLLLLSGKMWKLSKVIPVIQQRPLLFLGGFQAGAAEGLRLRHDHGSQFMSDDFQNELAFLGIESSPAFVREPEGNGCIERFFRTLKEQLLWVRPFQSIPELVRALEEFRALYNQHWLIERLGFEPPVQARQRLALQPAA